MAAVANKNNREPIPNQLHIYEDFEMMNYKTSPRVRIPNRKGKDCVDEDRKIRQGAYSTRRQGAYSRRLTQNAGNNEVAHNC